MTPGQINRLAAEYAEWYAPEKDYAEFPNMRETDMCIARDEMKQCLNWLLRDHLIVEKSKVQEIYNDANTYAKTLGEEDIIVKTMAVSHIGLLEQVFGYSTFNPTEK